MREAILKDGDFLIGNNVRFTFPYDRRVTIVDEEDHPIFGKRYKIKGHGEWFGENCFESIAGKNMGEKP